MKPITLTADEIAKLSFKETMHLNLGSGSYGYGYQAALYPRLGFIDYTYRGRRAEKEGCSRRRVWRVDGANHATIEEAIAALAKEPVLTEDEVKVLALLGDAPEDLRAFERRAEEALGIPAPADGTNDRNAADEAIYGLGNKDFIRSGRRSIEPRYEGDKRPWVPTIERRKV